MCAASSSSSAAIVVTQEEPDAASSSAAPILRLHLDAAAQNHPRVAWATDVVDNEHLNRKKSKCCCIYEKPRKFGESSSSESETECDHCRGHVEVKKKKKKRHGSDSSSNCSSDEEEKKCGTHGPDKHKDDNEKSADGAH